MKARNTVLVSILFAYAALPVWGESDVSGGWRGNVRLTNDPGNSRLSFNFAHCVAADNAGRVHVVWFADRDGGNQIYHKRSLDGRRSWGADTGLTNSAGTRFTRWWPYRKRPCT